MNPCTTQISTGYLNKLETGQVGSPSPRVLHRVAAALEIDYWTLMRLAEYVTPDYDGAGERMPDLPPTGGVTRAGEVVNLCGPADRRLGRGDLGPQPWQRTGPPGGWPVQVTASVTAAQA